jgi:hypothetical protein
MARTVPFIVLGSALCFSLFLPSCATRPRDARAASSYEEDATPESLPDFTLRWLFGVGMGRKLHVDRMQLYYVDPITEQQAQSTGRFLHRLGIGQNEQLVQIRKNAQTTPPVYELRIGTSYVRTSDIDRETRTVYQLMALSAEGLIFDGSPVQVYLCNSLLQPLVILRPRLKPLSGQAD